MDEDVRLSTCALMRLFVEQDGAEREIRRLKTLLDTQKREHDGRMVCEYLPGHGYGVLQVDMGLMEHTAVHCTAENRPSVPSKLVTSNPKSTNSCLFLEAP